MVDVATSVRRLQRLKTVIALSLLTLLSILYPTVIEPNWIQVVYRDLVMPHLDPAFENYRIVQISDIHADDWMTDQRLLTIVNRVNQQQPDLVAITGDFVTTQAQRYAPVLSALSSLTPPDGIVGVLGNHDYWSDSEKIRRSLIEAGVKVLDNKVISVNRVSSDSQQTALPQLNIAGIDDVWMGRDRLDWVLAQLPSTGANVLLVHEPDFAEQSALTHRFDLELSGHSHGGQVKLPIVGAPQLPPYGRLFPFGQYKVQEMVHYTNRGVGMVKPRVRLNARPEITVFTLHTVNQTGDELT